MDSINSTTQKEPLTPTSMPPKTPTKTPKIIISSTEKNLQRRPQRRYSYPPVPCYDRNEYKRELYKQAYSPIVAPSSSKILSVEPFSLDSAPSSPDVDNKDMKFPRTRHDSLYNYNQHNRFMFTKAYEPFLSSYSYPSKNNSGATDTLTPPSSSPKKRDYDTFPSHNNNNTIDTLLSLSSSLPNTSTDNSLLSPKNDSVYYYSYTGLSSPNLSPINLNENNTNNQYHDINDEINAFKLDTTTSLISSKHSNGGKKVTDDFLFRENWPQEVTSGKHNNQPK